MCVFVYAYVISRRNEIYVISIKLVNLLYAAFSDYGILTLLTLSCLLYRQCVLGEVGVAVKNCGKKTGRKSLGALHWTLEFQ